jgi:hypothetical protein
VSLIVKLWTRHQIVPCLVRLKSIAAASNTNMLARHDAWCPSQLPVVPAAIPRHDWTTDKCGLPYLDPGISMHRLADYTRCLEQLCARAEGHGHGEDFIVAGPGSQKIYKTGPGWPTMYAKGPFTSNASNAKRLQHIYGTSLIPLPH